MGLDGGSDTKGQRLPLPAMDPCILVVDDHPEIRRFVARALTDARYAVLEAEDGAVALQILERGGVDIDLVLTDIRMPRLGGIELGRRIADRRWRVAVLYVTGGQDDASVAVEPLLWKPFSMGTLLETVDRMLLGRRAGQAAAVKPLSAATSGAR